MGFYGIDKSTDHLYRGRTECRRNFKHRIYDGRMPFQYYVRSNLLVAQLVHCGSPSTQRDTIQRHCTRALVQKVLDNIRAPICDHHLLSDRKVLNSYDPSDIDIEEGVPHRILPPPEHMRTSRRSDGSCSFCQAMGVQTNFRFHATTYQSLSYLGEADIRIEVVLTRNLGACLWKSWDRPNRHWRCHGITQRKLAKFRDAGGPDPVAFIFFDGTIIS